MPSFIGQESCRTQLEAETCQNSYREGFLHSKQREAAREGMATPTEGRRIATALGKQGAHVRKSYEKNDQVSRYGCEDRTATPIGAS